MLQTQIIAPSLTAETAQIVLPEPTSAQPQLIRDRIRHLLYGSPRAIHATIIELHQLGYVEHFRWTPIAAIPETGIAISPEQAEAYSLLLKELQLESGIENG